MSYNPYGAPSYGAPPGYGAYPAAGAPPGVGPAPGLGPPPGMSSAPGMAPPPGVQQSSQTQANRPSGLPAFQPPPNLPNINFNAPVIRLGAPAGKPSTPDVSSRRDGPPSSASRPGLGMGMGMDRNVEQSRQAVRESMAALVPPTHEERLRTIFLHKIPEGVGGDAGVEKILSAVGKVRRWDSTKSHLQEGKNLLFGFAQFDDADSLATAVELLKDVHVPAAKQEPTAGPAADEGDDSLDEIDKVKLQVTVDESTTKYLESHQENRGDDAEAKARLESCGAALKRVIRDMFYPPLRAAQDGEGDVSMGNTGQLGENVEVINIPLAQEDELADIPAEMREVVAAEIAAFRERSNRRDMERLKREEELEEMERQRNGVSRGAARESSPPGAVNNIPLGPRGVPNAPSGPRGQNAGRMSFVNGGTTNGDMNTGRDDDTDASDDELYGRELAKVKSEEDKMYLEAERKWVNRERQRAAALERERDRDKQEADTFDKRREDQLQRDRSWDDEREWSRKTSLYTRDHAAWVRKRGIEKADEEARDEADRRAEAAERRREAAEMDHARDMADSFLEQQAQEMERRQPAAPQPFKLSLGAAAQKAQAQRAPAQRRTVAEVEGLLDNEEQDQTVRRQLVPIKFDPPAAGAESMTPEETTKAVRALAQEIPAEKEGLWAWEVKWDFLDDFIVRDKLRPFVEKKVVEYLGVQEQFLVEVVADHLRKHGGPAELVENLAEALDDAAEDLVKKLWRMLIFFTESEKRGLPA